MRSVSRIVLGAVALLLCGYVLAIFIGVAGCADNGSGTGNIRTTAP